MCDWDRLLIQFVSEFAEFLRVQSSTLFPLDEVDDGAIFGANDACGVLVLFFFFPFFFLEGDLIFANNLSRSED